MRRLTAGEVEREISALDILDLDALKARWVELFKSEPPTKIRSAFLRRAMAYRIQERAFGGLKSATKAKLKRLAEQSWSHRGTDGLPATPRETIRLSAGTRLMREWDGSTEVVEAVETGFTWRGKTYRTLSAVAVAITGTKWSGPKFFGLRADQSSARSVK